MGRPKCKAHLNMKHSLICFSHRLPRLLWKTKLESLGQRSSKILISLPCSAATDLKDRPLYLYEWLNCPTWVWSEVDFSKCLRMFASHRWRHSDFHRLGVSNHLLLHSTGHLTSELSKCQAAPSVFKADTSAVQNPCHELSYLLTLKKCRWFLFLTYRLVFIWIYFMFRTLQECKNFCFE